MRKRFYEAQVIDFLLDIDTPATLQELCRKHGFSEASYAAAFQCKAGDAMVRGDDKRVVIW